METRLQDLCSVKLVIDFCMQPHVKSVIFSKAVMHQSISFESEPPCHFLDFNIKGKFSDSLKKLPDLVRKNMPYYLIPLIESEMMKWTHFHVETFCLDESYCFNFMRSFLFNNKGVLNKELAATELVKDESLPTTLRFDIAYYYFLLEYIRTFWKTLTEEEKCLLGHDPTVISETTFVVDSNFDYVESVWKVHKQKSMKELTEKDESEINLQVWIRGCIYSFCSKREVSFKNYFEKLGKPSKEFVLRFLGRILCFKLDDVTIDTNIYAYSKSRESFIKMTEYLFCKLTYDELQNLSHPHLYYIILKAFLFWPYQYLFMKVAKMFWKEISNSEFYILLHLIINFIEDQRFSNTYDYRFLFISFWEMGSPNYKKYVLSIESGETLPNPYLNSPEYIKHENEIVNKNEFLLTKIFQLINFNNDDQFTIKLLMRDASEDVKQKIVVQQGDEICYDVLSAGKFEVADLFFYYCVPKYFVNEFKSNLLTKRDYILQLLKISDNIEIAEKVFAYLSHC